MVVMPPEDSLEVSALSVVVIPIELPAGVRGFNVVVIVLASICSTAVCVVVIETPELVEEETLELVVEVEGGTSLSSVVVIEIELVAIGCAPLSVFVIEISPELVSLISRPFPIVIEELDAEAVNVIVTLDTDVTVVLVEGGTLVLVDAEAVIVIVTLDTEVTMVLGREVLLEGGTVVLVDTASPHIFQHRQLPAILSNPICVKFAYPGYTIGADALPVQFEPE